jgi:ABC-type multidrug transport system permease subunit
LSSEHGLLAWRRWRWLESLVDGGAQAEGPWRLAGTILTVLCFYFLTVFVFELSLLCLCFVFKKGRKHTLYSLTH